jgi:hypothetical protein
MSRAAPLIALLLLGCLVAPPDAVAAQLNYTLYVLAVPLAHVVFNVDLASSSYRMTFHLQTTGLADVFANDHIEERTEGRFENDRPAPADYGSSSRLRGQDRIVGMVWRDGTPVVTTISPPNAAEREDVPAALRPHTVDPLSAVVLLLRQVAQTGRCDASIRTYDGRRLELFAARTTAEEDLSPSGRSSFAGRALRCDFTDQTLAGFHLGPSRDEDARERRGTIWMSQVFSGGPRLPVRISLETRLLGDATLYLTAAFP